MFEWCFATNGCLSTNCCLSCFFIHYIYDTFHNAFSFQSVIERIERLENRELNRYR